ncbi:LOW QUALITY PROTEIN: toll-like receptor 4 [Triplophysa dalaica]|uniref:LOW QUALITY PROTEIN: toll-like receptor 4 n=1 Tax=Triplophysa dalaica TaxID=1582913 RepID=UPI0024E03235|nr:LOW QUALITY PROTEIN: toll-like receptor 4 [Triplophysa dalaica]
MNYFSLSVFMMLFSVGGGESCTNMSENQHYSCMGRNLSYIPASIPSSVHTLDFSFNVLKHLQKTVFPVLPFLQVLDLSRCHIKRIENDSFYNVRNLTSLILTGNPVTHFGLECFNVLHNLTKLQELKVGTNKIQSMTLPSFMSTFTHFSLLDLHANNISIIKSDHTAVLREIGRNMTLILCRNPILHIEPGAFKDIYLKELDIRSAFVSFAAQKVCLNALYGLTVKTLVFGRYKGTHWFYSVDPDFLEGLCSIHFQDIYYYITLRPRDQLNIFNCMINATKVVVKGGVFHKFPTVHFSKIKELNMLSNLLEALPGKSFHHLQTLEKLVIRNSKIVQVETLADMPKLQYVDLSSNQIAYRGCCTTLLSGTPQIKNLNMSLNSEIGFSAGAFDGLDSLEILDFHHTSLIGMGYLSCLANLKNLKYLDISFASITFFNIFSFRGLISLNVLKIAGNHFTLSVLRYLFNNFTNLEYLDLSYCHLAELHPNSFKDLQNLQMLILSGNKLMTVDFLTFSNLEKLTSLYVNKNSITSISLDVLQKLPTNLSVFDLSTNPIECSCAHTDFILWIIEHQGILEQPQNILCKSFSASSNFPAIDFDINRCVYNTRLTVILLICCVIAVTVLSAVVYRFQFHLKYCCILLKGYKLPKQQECSYDAFVIFSSYDEMWVMNELVENLENGVPPVHLCLHMRDFEPGKSIASNIIDEGIMGSQKVIVVVSQHFIDSAWCRFEFELAQSWFVMERNANIIIIILEDVQERKTKKVFGLHKHLKKNTYLKWSRDPLSNMRFWIRLRKAVIATKK